MQPIRGDSLIAISAPSYGHLKEDSMSNDSNRSIEQPGRRRVLKQAAVAGATLVVGPYFTGRANAQAGAQVSDMAPYQQAKINWRQVEGEQITVAVIPAGYFDNLITI